MANRQFFLQVGIFTIAFHIFFGVAKGNTELRVCGTCEFTTIASAVEAAPSGASILVDEGMYRENHIRIDKAIRLRGVRPDQVTVDGENQGSVFLVSADNVEISGFTIINSGVSYTEELAGIRAMDSAGCSFTNNILEANQFGIYLGRVRTCTVSNNRVRGTDLSESSSGNGVHVWYGEDITVTGNDLSKHRDGLYFEFVKNSSVRSNRSHLNLRYGLHFMFSDRNEYRANFFVDNGSGVAVMYSKSIRMFSNHFTGSRGGAAYGILLKDISDSMIVANDFLGNTIGAYLEGTTRSEFSANRFTRNGWALRILGDCDTNTFSKNDFIGNTFDVSTNSTSNQNKFSRNYWSRYRGIDLNHDGIGDDPYYPVQLSTMLMEHFGASVLLINSFFFMALDQIESVLPVFTPEAFKDSEPEMRRLDNVR